MAKAHSKLNKKEMKKSMKIRKRKRRRHKNIFFLLFFLFHLKSFLVLFFSSVLVCYKKICMLSLRFGCSLCIHSVFWWWTIIQNDVFQRQKKVEICHFGPISFWSKKYEHTNLIQNCVNCLYVLVVYCYQLYSK
jgi:hypothetical protein